MMDFYTKEERAAYNARYYRANKGKVKENKSKVNRRDYYTKEQRAAYNAKRKNLGKEREKYENAEVLTCVS